eukprot:364141-Chlamydomonas_euryale.AAC.2
MLLTVRRVCKGAASGQALSGNPSTGHLYATFVPVYPAVLSYATFVLFYPAVRLYGAFVPFYPAVCLYATFLPFHAAVRVCAPFAPFHAAVRLGMGVLSVPASTVVPFRIQRM